MGNNKATAQPQKRMIGLRTGSLVIVAGKVRQVLNDYMHVGVFDLAYLGGALLPGGKLREFCVEDSMFTVRIERISLSQLEAAGAIEIDTASLLARGQGE